jgi:hypothetical protein
MGREKMAHRQGVVCFVTIAEVHVVRHWPHRCRWEHQEHLKKHGRSPWHPACVPSAPNVYRFRNLSVVLFHGCITGMSSFLANDTRQQQSRPTSATTI